jgi:hypothetical protein
MNKSVSAKHEAIRYLDRICAVSKPFAEEKRGIFGRKHINHYQIGFMFGLMSVVLDDHMKDDREFLGTATQLISRHFGNKDLSTYLEEILKNQKYGVVFQKEGAKYMRRYFELEESIQRKISPLFPTPEHRPGDMLIIAEGWAN